MPPAIKDEVKAESRKKLVALWKANGAKEAARASKEAAGIGSQLGSIQDKARAELLAALDANPATRNVRKEMASIEKAARALAKQPVISAKQRQVYKKELRKLLEAADVNEKTHRRTLVHAFDEVVPTHPYRVALLKAMKKPGRLMLKEGKYGGFLNIDWNVPRFDLIDWDELPQTSFTFEAPYEDAA